MKLTEGRWLIVTATSHYTVDVDEGWLIRKPGAGPFAGDGRHIVTAMIADEEKVPLAVGRDVEVEIGQRAVFYTSLIEGGWRMTTAVQQVWFLDRETGEGADAEILGGETQLFGVID